MDTRQGTRTGPGAQGAVCPAPGPGLAQLKQELQVQEKALEEELERLRTIWDRDTSPIVTADDIAELVAMWTGVPVMQLAQEESVQLLNMESEIKKHIIGQREAIERISKAVRRGRADRHCR